MEIRTHARKFSRAPDVIFGSLCGKKFRPEIVAVLTDGLAQIHARRSAWQKRQQ